MSVLMIISIIFLLLIVFMLMAVYYVGNLRRKFRQKITEQYPNAIFITEAQSFGQQSLGRMQARGTGTLALTTDTLHFELWRPNRSLPIPLNAITNIDVARSFLGKSQFKPLLKVEFTNQDGQVDAIAWGISGLDNIKQQIEQAIQSAK